MAYFILLPARVDLSIQQTDGRTEQARMPEALAQTGVFSD
jgi:hypothetical protein